MAQTVNHLNQGGGTHYSSVVSHPLDLSRCSYATDHWQQHNTCSIMGSCRHAHGTSRYARTISRHADGISRYGVPARL